MMKTVIVLAMHGAPPNDFPRREMAEFFDLHARQEHAAGLGRTAQARRYAELHAKMRAWPRTVQNDPFWAASQELAEHLSLVTDCEVVLGFNEFCAPDMDAALEQAMAKGAGRVTVITPMLTPGGEHAAVDIPAVIRLVQDRHPKVPISYAWPFEVSRVAQFLADQISRVA
jgi:sirohydrochlorin cobaltochelatase